MANTENKVSQEVIHCDYCMDDGQTITAAAFCIRCGKYLCASCIKSHGKFMPDHSLKHGSEMPNKEDAKTCMPCKIHTDQVKELFCKDHKSVFCKCCKLLKHSKCDTQTIQLAIKDMNVKEEFDATLAHLIQLQENIEKKQAESQHKLKTYSKDKREIKTKVNTIQKQLNEIFDDFKRRLDDKEQTDIEALNAQVESYLSFLRQLDSHLKLKKAVRSKTKDEGLFLHLKEMTEIYEEYKRLTNHVVHISNDFNSFILQDDRLTPVVQKLNGITSDKERRIEKNAENGNLTNSDLRTMTKTDQSCQTENIQLGKLEEMKQASIGTHSSENQRKNPFVLNDDQEKDSSEEYIEKPMGRYFSKLKYCRYLKSKSLETSNLTDCCMMLDGKVICCVDSYIKIWDANLQNCWNFCPWRSNYPKLIAVMDKNSFVVSLSSAKVLQIFSVTPEIEVEIRGEISLKLGCSGLKFQNKKIYVYVNDQGSEFSGLHRDVIQILSLNGELIKNIPLPLADTFICFSVNKSGSIIYVCNRFGKHCLKCIATDGSVFFCKSTEEYPVTVIPDDEGNMIIGGSKEKKISVIKSDGSQGPVLAELSYTPKILCYNKCNNTLLTFSKENAGRGNPMIHRLHLYQMEFF